MSADAASGSDGMAYIQFSDEMVRMIEEDLTDGDLVTRSVGLNQSLEALGIISMERVFSHGGEFEEQRREAGLHKWYIVTYAPTVPFTKASGNLSGIEGVESVEPVRRIALDNKVNFNDWIPEIWGLHNEEQQGIDINVVPVWENYTKGNPNVIVAVVDSGVDVKHEDLAANCAVQHFNYTAAGPIVPENHGTHVAGTIAAVSNNDIGLCGIAGGDAAKGEPGVTIMSFQIFQGNKNGNSAEAIVKAAEEGAVICQNSWGYSYDLDGNGSLDSDERARAKNDVVLGPDKAAIDYFIKNAGCDKNGNQRANSPMKGGLVVFAAGNDNIDNAAPANYEAVIAVGAIDQTGKKADFSNYGSWVDIAAPGVSIYSTLPGNDYGFSQGTSMACPHVSGVAALVLSYYGGQGFTAEMLKEKILMGANTSKISSTYKIGGLLDAYGAITYGDGVTPEPITDIKASGQGNSINLSWTQTADSKGMPVYGALVIYSKDRQAVETATAQSHPGCELYAHEIDMPVGETVNCSVTGLEFSAQYYCKVINYTYGMAYSSPTEVLDVSTTENHAPQMQLMLGEQPFAENVISLYAYETLTYTVVVSDPDNHSVELSYTSGSAADLIKTQLDGKYLLIITGKEASTGTYTGMLTLKDEYDMTSQFEIKYEIKENSAPEIIKELDDIFLTSRSEFMIDMSEYVSDPDGEQLKYDIIIANPQILHLSAKKNTIYGTPLQFGESDVQIKAMDARGESVEFNIKVVIKNPSDPLSLYPNPVKDYLYVATLDMTETEIRIYTSSGKLMHEEVSQVSGIKPAQIDMRDYAPGVYAVRVTFGGKEYKKNIVKL